MKSLTKINFGLHPITNRYQKKNNKKAPRYSLELFLDKKDDLIQIKKKFPIKQIRPRFDWITCYEPEDHLDELVRKITLLPSINKNSLIGGYSFKDLSTLTRLKKRGFNNIRLIDPKKDLKVKINNFGIETIEKNFNKKNLLKLEKKIGKFKVLIIRHVLEHSYNIKQFISNIKNIISDDGYAIFEIPDCEKSLRNKEYTMIWEEHTFYFTKHTFKKILLKYGFVIKFYKAVNYTLENSLIAIVKKNKNKVKIKNNIIPAQKKIFSSYCVNFKENYFKVNSFFKNYKYKNKDSKILIYGAGHFTSTFISIMKLEKYIDFIVDDDDNKKGLFLPAGNIPIIHSTNIYKLKVGICLLSINPNNFKIILNKHKKFLKKGNKFYSIFTFKNSLAPSIFELIK